MTGTTSDKYVNLWELYICGLIGGIGIFEVGHLAALFLKKSVSFGGMLILGMLVLYALAVVSVLVICRKKGLLKIGMGRTCRKKELLQVDSESRCEKKGISEAGVAGLAGLVFGILVIAQIIYICMTPMVQALGDITLETVNTFLVFDGIYTVSPLTGEAYGGAPLRYEILCLPTVYTLLCRWFHMAPEVLVGSVVPVVTLCTAYVAYYLLSGCLFGKEKEAAEKRMWFLAMVAVIFFLSENAVYMEGYGILHAGHLGTTIRNSILVPFLLYGALEKKWWIAVLCMLAEVCIVWTFWGFGVCAAVLAGVVSVRRIQGYVRRKGLFSGIRKKEGNGR